MNTKLAGLLAGSALAMMMAFPIGLAHTAGGNEPSGTYVGSAGPWIRLDGVDMFAGNALCDLEVMSDGDASTTDDNNADEPDVDGAPRNTGGSLPTAAEQAEGSWDDGGQGAICHTPDTHYVNPTYNTQNCDFGSNVATSTSVANPWLSTSCDYETVVAGPNGPTLDILALNMVGCTANAVLTQNAAEIVTDCVDGFLDCTVGLGLDADSCPVPPGGTVACGADGTVDSTNEGPGATGVAYPGYGSCLATDGVAATFVWDAVVIDSVAMTQTVYLAGTGQVL